MRSWSMAAARKVSAAARNTDRPSRRNRAASFAAVVVLPLPFTPTRRITPRESGTERGTPMPGTRRRVSRSSWAKWARRSEARGTFSLLA